MSSLPYKVLYINNKNKDRLIVGYRTDEIAKKVVDQFNTIKGNIKATYLGVANPNLVPLYLGLEK